MNSTKVNISIKGIDNIRFSVLSNTSQYELIAKLDHLI